MTSILLDVLQSKFGRPDLSVENGVETWWWLRGDEDRRSELYRRLSGARAGQRNGGEVLEVYGDFFGGFLAGGPLKVATLDDEVVWGLPTIEKLHDLPAVRRAREIDPSVEYFMDAGNVWYYGIKGGELYCYDREADEFYGMGTAPSAIAQLVDEWNEAVADPPTT